MAHTERNIISDEINLDYKCQGGIDLKIKIWVKSLKNFTLTESSKFSVFGTLYSTLRAQSRYLKNSDHCIKWTSCSSLHARF